MVMVMSGELPSRSHGVELDEGLSVSEGMRMLGVQVVNAFDFVRDDGKLRSEKLQADTDVKSVCTENEQIAIEEIHKLKTALVLASGMLGQGET